MASEPTSKVQRLDELADRIRAEYEARFGREVSDSYCRGFRSGFKACLLHLGEALEVVNETATQSQ